MEQIELIQHWNYFCSLAERLDDTKHYIDHGLQEHNGKRELVHGKVYSDVFKQIIVLSASEFEIMSKALCHKKGVKTKKIGDISETRHTRCQVPLNAGCLGGNDSGSDRVDFGLDTV